MIATSLVTRPLTTNQKRLLAVMDEMKHPQRPAAIHRAVRDRFGGSRRSTPVTVQISSLVIRGLVRRVNVQSGPMKWVDLYERTEMRW
jgi:hypothetical protein